MLSLALDPEAVASAWEEQVGGSIFFDHDAEHAVPTAITLDMSEVEACLHAAQNPSSAKLLDAQQAQQPGTAVVVPATKPYSSSKATSSVTEALPDLLSWQATIPLPLCGSQSPMLSQRQQLQLQPSACSDAGQLHLQQQQQQQQFQRVPEHNTSSSFGSCSSSNSSSNNNPVAAALPAVKRAKSSKPLTGRVASRRIVQQQQLQLQPSDAIDSQCGVVPDAWAAAAAAAAGPTSSSSSTSSESSCGEPASVSGTAAGAPIMIKSSAADSAATPPAAATAAVATAATAATAAWPVVPMAAFLKVDPSTVPADAAAAALAAQCQAASRALQQRHAQLLAQKATKQQQQKAAAAATQAPVSSAAASAAIPAAGHNRSWTSMMDSKAPAGQNAVKPASTAAAAAAAPRPVLAAAVQHKQQQHSTRPVQHAAAVTAAAGHPGGSGNGNSEPFVRTRAEALARYREKRARRSHSKVIRYHLRKVNADKRPRIKGRFVKKEEMHLYFNTTSSTDATAAAAEAAAAAAAAMVDGGDVCLKPRPEEVEKVDPAAAAAAPVPMLPSWEQDMQLQQVDLLGLGVGLSDGNAGHDMGIVEMEGDAGAGAAAVVGHSGQLNAGQETGADKAAAAAAAAGSTAAMDSLLFGEEQSVPAAAAAGGASAAAAAAGSVYAFSTDLGLMDPLQQLQQLQFAPLEADFFDEPSDMSHDHQMDLLLGHAF